MSITNPVYENVFANYSWNTINATVAPPSPPNNTNSSLGGDPPVPVSNPDY